jgi:hypothetical protein
MNAVGEGDKVQSSPILSNPVREVNECTISNANKANTTGAQRDREKTSDLERDGKIIRPEAVCGGYRTRRVGGLIYR